MRNNHLVKVRFKESGPRWVGWRNERRRYISNGAWVLDTRYCDLCEAAKIAFAGVGAWTWFSTGAFSRVKGGREKFGGTITDREYPVEETGFFCGPDGCAAIVLVNGIASFVNAKWLKQFKKAGLELRGNGCPQDSLAIYDVKSNRLVGALMPIRGVGSEKEQGWLKQLGWVREE